MLFKECSLWRRGAMSREETSRGESPFTGQWDRIPAVETSEPARKRGRGAWQVENRRERHAEQQEQRG